jgi:hypothetical protein
MQETLSRDDRRALLDAKLTELSLYAKELCPDAVVEASAVQYEDEDGHVDIHPPSGLSEEEEEGVELAVAARAAKVFEETGLYILCAVLDPVSSAARMSQF